MKGEVTTPKGFLKRRIKESYSLGGWQGFIFSARFGESKTYPHSINHYKSREIIAALSWSFANDTQV